MQAPVLKNDMEEEHDEFCCNVETLDFSIRIFAYLFPNVTMLSFTLCYNFQAH